MARARERELREMAKARELARARENQPPVLAMAAEMLKTQSWEAKLVEKMVGRSQRDGQSQIGAHKLLN